MIPTLGIIAIATAITLIEVPALRRNRHIKELWVFSLLLLFGTAISIAWVLHAQLPNPLDGLTIIYKPFYDILMRLLK